MTGNLRGERLVRALQRGGYVARRAGGWAVWRRGDQRSRHIGVISDTSFRLLRADGSLAPDPQNSGRWIWAATAARRRSATMPGRVRALVSNPPIGGTTSALDEAVSRVLPVKFRPAVLAAARRFERQAEAAARGDGRLDQGLRGCFKDQEMAALVDLIVHQRAPATQDDDGAGQGAERLLLRLAQAYRLVPASQYSDHFVGADRSE